MGGARLCRGLTDPPLSRARLNRNPDIKAISYVIGAATESGKQNQLVELQDLEYKLAGFVKQFQWQYGTTLACHGAIGLWRRDILGTRILYEVRPMAAARHGGAGHRERGRHTLPPPLPPRLQHDTAFHGEDMYMGACLWRAGQRRPGCVLTPGAPLPPLARTAAAPDAEGGWGQGLRIPPLAGGPVTPPLRHAPRTTRSWSRRALWYPRTRRRSCSSCSGSGSGAGICARSGSS